MGHKILILTDDNVFFLLLSTLIKHRNEYITCIKMLQLNELDEDDEKNYEMIIVDGKIMSISAIELIYELRYNYKITKAIWLFTFIDISAYLDKALEVGANKIIPKPFDPEAISDEIVAYIQKRNLKYIPNNTDL